MFDDQEKPPDNLRAWIFQVAYNLALKRRVQVYRDLGTATDRPRIFWWTITGAIRARRRTVTYAD